MRVNNIKNLYNKLSALYFVGLMQYKYFQKYSQIRIFLVKIKIPVIKIKMLY